MNRMVFLSRDGAWPFVWNWRAEVEVGPHHDPRTRHISGCALTKGRAHTKARRALRTCEFHDYGLMVGGVLANDDDASVAA